MDKYKIDGHKLMYHVPRVHDWLMGHPICPIYIEVSPIGTCNHRCVFCGLDFMEYQNRSLDPDRFGKQIRTMARLGVKSVMFAGEGEPFLHPQIPDMIRETKKAGIEAAISSNGVRMQKPIIEKTLPWLEWIKIGVNGATPSTYAQINRTSPVDFKRVLTNIEDAVTFRNREKLDTVIGIQIVLLPENAHEVIPLAERVKNLGVDYLVVKPYSQHLKSKTQRYANIQYGQYSYLKEALRPFNDHRFQVIFRVHAMDKWDRGERTYHHCYALPFWAYIDAGGNVWACGAQLGDHRFLYGNIQTSDIADLLTSPRRSAILKWAGQELDSNQCRLNCRMDEVNRYLWELKTPQPHVNFI